MNQEKTYNMYLELRKNNDLKEIASMLSLHTGTLKRWESIKKIPMNYYNDLNSLLGNKYDSIDCYRNKDQFYTKSNIAEYVILKTIEILNHAGINLSLYTFIEPSAGNCNFYELLPEDRRIGIDIEPKGYYSDQLIKKNYLDYVPNINGKYIVIGNPPFGLRGNLALRFINHSSKFADFVSFILPPLFNSRGKGVPMKRVKGYTLIHTEKLPLDAFYYPDGSDVKIATIFQIWSKIDSNLFKNKTRKSVSQYIKVYSLSNGNTPSSKRNVKMLDKCDVYLPSTTFHGMKAYSSFNELPNKRGYGIVILKKYHEILNLLMHDTNWEDYSFHSTNSAMNLRTEIIENVLIERGFINDI